MASRDKHDATSFLSRWSQRKRAAEAAEEEVAPQDAPAAADAAQDVAARDAGAAAEPEQIDPASLPDIDSLDASSDFSVFMRQGVPAALQRRALRRLWQVDPAFHEICMLDDYNLDYTDAATVVPNLKTVYQVGRGMVLGDEAEADKAPEERLQDVAGQITEGTHQEGEALPQETRSESAPVAEAADAAESPAPDRQRRRPSGPKVAAATPRGIMPGDGPRSAPRSARQRRWGDSGNS